MRVHRRHFTPIQKVTPMRRLQLSILALALALPLSAVFADLTLQLETRDLGVETPEVETSTLFLTEDKFAADDVEPDGTSTKTIFDRESNTMWYVEHDSKSYMTMDEQGMRAMAAQFEAAMQQMQKQLESMPPEQRQQMEEMMKSQMPGMDAKKHTLDVVATGKKETVLGKACTSYEVRVDGEKISEVWATSWKDAGVPKESLSMLYALTDFFEDLATSNPLLGDALAAEGGFLQGLDRIDGFPLRIVDFEEGEPSSETLMKSVSRESIDAAIFEVPAGYRQKSFDDE